MTIAEIKKIISRIHDKTKKDSKPPTGNQNCQLCTWCLEAQFRGIKVLPRPIYSPRDPALDVPGENIVINPTKKKFKNFDLLSNYVLQEPKARYYVHVKWNNGYGGHEFILWNTNVPHILDAQQGLCEPMTDLKTFHEYFGDINYNESFICRLDDHEFNETLLNEMNAMSMLIPWDETVDTQYMKDHDMLGEEEFTQEFDHNSKKMPVKGLSIDKFYFGSPTKYDGQIKLDRPLFVSPFEGIASIFIYGDLDLQNRTPRGSYNLQYEEWNSASDEELSKPFREVHVYVEGYPELKPYTIENTGYIHTVDASKYGNDIYRYDWMANDLEYLIDTPERIVDIESVKQVTVKYIISGKATNNPKLGPYKTTQEAFIDDRTRPLVPVTDIDFDTVYYGDAINAGKTRVLDGKPLFVSPLKGIASIFSDRRGRIREEMHKRGCHNYDMGYIEWFLPLDQLQKPLKEVHVYIKRYPDLEPFEFEGEGYIHTIDISKLKDKMCRFDWMEPNREILIAGVDSVDIKKVEKAKVKYYVAGINYYDKSLFQEGFIQEDIPPVGAIFKAGLAANKAKNQLKAADLDISDYKQIPLTEESMYEYKEGHGTFTYGLDNFLYHDDDEGLILLDERDFIAGYILIRTLPDNKKWIISCEHSYEFPNDGITYQLLQLAPDMFDVEYARFPSSDKLICNQLIELGWKPIRQDGGLVFFQYDPSDEEEEDDDIDYDRMISEYVMESFRANKLVYHLSTHRNLDGQVFKPRVPSYLNEYDPHEKEFENNTTPRVCFSPSIDGALNAICVNLYRLNPVQFSDVYVYIPEKPLNQYKQKSNKEIIRDHDVFDANLTKEMWILEPVRLKLYGVIHVDQVRNVKRKHTAKNVDGERGDRRIFSYKWHWLVKPKVLDSQPYNYDTMAVCKMVADEIARFKYGLVKDGKLVRNTKESDWDKYWRLQSPEEFEKSGAGNCYDYTEWEAGFLDAYGIAYKKYFISGMNIDQKLATHTFIVASNKNKFIYIEGAFKRVVDEIGNLKEFDSLPSIFKYVAECMCEYENFGTMNYGVLDYTDNSPKSGTDIKHFIDWITHNCEMVYAGTIKTKHNKKE